MDSDIILKENEVEVKGGLVVDGSLHVNGPATGAQGFRTVSDARCKEEVETIDGALEVVHALRGVRFRWREDACEGMEVSDGPQVGFLAQEVAEVLPEAVQQGEDGYYTLNANAVVPVLVEAIKVLQCQFEDQANRLRDIEAAVRATPTSIQRAQDGKPDRLDRLR